MDPLNLASIAAVGDKAVNALTGAGSFLWNLYAQKKTWEREDTAVQRRVKDLQAAGLNPVLAASGAGASTSAPIRMSGLDSDIAGGISKARDLMIQKNLVSQSGEDYARAMWDQLKAKEEFHKSRIESDILQETREQRLEVEKLYLANEKRLLENAKAPQELLENLGINKNTSAVLGAIADILGIGRGNISRALRGSPK